MKTYYDILGVSEGGSGDEINRAFRTLAQKYHPDAGGGDEAAKKFKQVNEAYQTLKDEQKRKVYDIFLQRQRGSYTNPTPPPSPTQDESQYRPPSAYQGQTSPPSAQRARPRHAPSLGFQRFLGGLRTLGFALLGIAIMAGVDFLRRQLIGLDYDTSDADFYQNIALVPIMGFLAAISLVEESSLEKYLRARFGDVYLLLRSLAACLSGAFLGAMVADILNFYIIEAESFRNAIRIGMVAGAIVVGWIANYPQFWHAAVKPKQWFSLSFALVRSLMITALFVLVAWVVVRILLFFTTSDDWVLAIFYGALLGSIFGSIAPSDLKAYARYASAYVGRMMVLLLILLGFGAGVVVGVLS